MEIFCRNLHYILYMFQHNFTIKWNEISKSQYFIISFTLNSLISFSLFVDMKRKEPAEYMQLVSPKNNDYAEDINVSKLLCKCDANIFIELL